MFSMICVLKPDGAIFTVIRSRRIGLTGQVARTAEMKTAHNISPDEVTGFFN
jgi:hypothetical protein